MGLERAEVGVLKTLNALTPMTEGQWQRLVIDAACRLGWEVHHEGNSFGTKPGWPDLALWRPAGFMGKSGRSIILAELKSDRGKVSPAQEERIATLRASGTMVYVWRPHDWDDVVSVLEN